MPAWDGLNIFLNIALVAVLTGLGYTYKNTRRTKYEGDRQKKIHDIYRSIQDNRFQAFLHERSREKERDNPTKAEADLVKVTRILMWWTALLASASLIGAIFAGFTLPAIRGQLDAMEADQRPWVSVQPVVDKPIYFDEWQEKSLSSNSPTSSRIRAIRPREISEFRPSSLLTWETPEGWNKTRPSENCVKAREGSLMRTKSAARPSFRAVKEPTRLARER
jgi:hypothetical protein